MIVEHFCYECGFRGDVVEKERKVKCPSCKIVNDVWLEGEAPPLNHKE